MRRHNIGDKNILDFTFKDGSPNYILDEIDENLKNLRRTKKVKKE
jgi:hypothetical protein